MPSPVTSPEAGHVTIVRGRGGAPMVMNYGCTPRCERTPMPGEDRPEYDNYAPAYVNYAARAAEGRAITKPAP